MTAWPSIPKSASQPFVSILTPTYNRRKFIPRIISYILAQTYPLERIEWVVLDDGTDAVEDLIAPYTSKFAIQYIRIPEKLNIGAKRNRLHKAARGDILVTMDDDDYYPPERVSHAVVTLRSRGARIAGATCNHLYFTDTKTIWSVGPYGPNHATFGTMAYTKDYAMKHPCDEAKLNAEEVDFTRRYTEPLVQLNPRKVMLVLCHTENTFSKNKLREETSPFIKKTTLKLKDFIGNAEDRAFYTALSAPSQ